MRMVAPAGMPISLGEISHALWLRLTHPDAADEFRQDMADMTGASHCFLVNSGRTALFVLLKALMMVSGKTKDEVIIPAYTCYSVAAAVVRAGLKIRLVDINPMAMDYCAESLARTDCRRVLAAIECNLFGIPGCFSQLKSVTEGMDVALIDDAAQAMGGKAEGGIVGARGDAGLFSLDRGKSLSTYSGGVLLTSDDGIAEGIEQQLCSLGSGGVFSEASLVAKLTAYSLFLRPQLYWLPESLPFLGLGETVYDESFAVNGLSVLQGCAGQVLFDRLSALNDQRRKVATALAGSLITTGEYEIPGYGVESCPAYVRLPVLARTQEVRDYAIERLRNRGIVASRMYPTTIHNIPGIRDRLAGESSEFPGAERVVRCLLTLPTHPYVSHYDIDAIISCLSHLQ